METRAIPVFENGVILYGGKTIKEVILLHAQFENGVILYGGKTEIKWLIVKL